MSVDFDQDQTHDVKISEVKPLETRLNCIFQVVEKKEEREIEKRAIGETHRVCDFQVADETGSIVLTLWNEDIDMMEIGEVYKLSNGFANVFQNSLRLSKGKFGTIEKDSHEFDEINEDNDRSSEHVEDPRRQRRRSYGGDRSYGGYGSDRHSSNRRSYGSRRRGY
ncbi:MAG: hypothetical protein ACTSW1_06045 [Candidatus Hodarchaeales archaeon]